MQTDGFKRVAMAMTGTAIALVLLGCGGGDEAAADSQAAKASVPAALLASGNEAEREASGVIETEDLAAPCEGEKPDEVNFAIQRGEQNGSKDALVKTFGKAKGGQCTQVFGCYARVTGCQKPLHSHNGRCELVNQFANPINPILSFPVEGERCAAPLTHNQQIYFAYGAIRDEGSNLPNTITQVENYKTWIRGGWVSSTEKATWKEATVYCSCLLEPRYSARVCAMTPTVVNNANSCPQVFVTNHYAPLYMVGTVHLPIGNGQCERFNGQDFPGGAGHYDFAGGRWSQGGDATDWIATLRQCAPLIKINN